MALPTLLVVTMALAWLLALGVAQVRVVDAARETARAVARGDDESAALAVGRRVAPDGAVVRVSRVGDQVVVEASGTVAPPGGALVRWAAVRLHSRAVAVAEEDG
jgi:hypothetical protein